MSRVTRPTVPATTPAVNRGWIDHLVLKGPISRAVSNRTQLAFSPGINVLVGPNGSGKSTVLRIIRDRDWAKRHGCQIWREGPGDRNGNVPWVAFDGEQDNPRAKHGMGPYQFVNVDGSHGQVQRRVYAFLTSRIERGCVVLLDEPEVGLDMDGVDAMIRLITSRTDCQWIIASHDFQVWAIPGGQVVELVPGYRAAAIARARARMGG